MKTHELNTMTTTITERQTLTVTNTDGNQAHTVIEAGAQASQSCSYYMELDIVDLYYGFK